ncbi:MAG TPA: lipopolysaccharide kinase InaA family protein [Candidatus Binatia bacterium]
MARDWLWGDLPEGFKKIRLDRTRTLAVRADMEKLLVAELTADSSGRADSPFYGRGRLAVLKLDGGGRALARSYRHGGLLGGFTGPFFFTWPPRPLRELCVTEEARRRGVPTVEVLAASVERVCGPLYRCRLVTRELEGARDVWTILRQDSFPDGAKEALLAAMARSVRAMHRRGVDHGDLNLKNILARREGQGFKSYVIDFDKSRLFSGDLPAARAEKNLARLGRSIRKLDPGRRYLSPRDWEVFLARYREAGG